MKNAHDKYIVRIFHGRSCIMQPTSPPTGIRSFPIVIYPTTDASRMIAASIPRTSEITNKVKAVSDPERHGPRFVPARYADSGNPLTDNRVDQL
jgi:hypothetical protein